jgi:hypothetical protein
MTAIRLLAVTLAISLTACSQRTSWKGTIYRTYSLNVNAYSFTAKTDRTLFSDGRDPFVAKGDIYFMSERFPKRGQLVRKRSTAGQYKDVLDMSNENPAYRDELANYSVINGTGISSVMQYMDDPKVSPDGKYLSVTILGAPRNAFTKNCVAIFDVASQKLITKFDDKYYGSWTPDNRLVVCGTYKRGSADEKLYESSEPGIFITDRSLQSLSRIDPQLNDPSPYHASVSHDGKKVAYVLDGHIWVMNIDGSNNHQLTDVDNDNTETYPCFSPDDQFVACWAYKTFERSFFTAIAIVNVNTRNPIALSDKAAVWPKDKKGYRISGGSKQLSWEK